ncbi:unnamed protein product [Acanthoscelides obtectus]|uniref:Uncharacterized protein n=1 Tax=Acanthoscelides obtectus TaxID=200917 RepID=A0A9P0LTX2_ACAOB|nr:unnamed protein product [Acanthoscelides obtectus]CAK1659701.1 hypothetical protein AOBTE_LOCUS21634 [Acanthoscelides obtectus]
MSAITAPLYGLGAAAASNVAMFLPALVAAIAYFQYEELDPESAVVASRLSEIFNWKILLLEAGGDETEISDVPVMAAYLHPGQQWP